MSDIEGAASTQRLNSLLREYIESIRATQREADEIIASYVDANSRSLPNKAAVQQQRFYALREYLNAMYGGSTPLLRKVSQWIEHGTANEVEQMELNLRMVDLQASLQRAWNTVMSSPVR